jgi:hypothetical protein
MPQILVVGRLVFLRDLNRWRIDQRPRTGRQMMPSPELPAVTSACLHQACHETFNHVEHDHVLDLRIAEGSCAVGVARAVPRTQARRCPSAGWAGPWQEPSVHFVDREDVDSASVKGKGWTPPR